MSTAINILVATVALLHIYFLILEMYLWTTPYGRKTFGLSPSVAESSAVLAANQGLYNGFLAAGLLASFFFKSAEVALAFQLFFLACVILAGIYGALTVTKKIFYVQALPALIAFLLLLAR